MPRYRLAQRSYIGDSIREPGTEITVPDSVKPGPHWEPIDDAAHTAMKKHEVEYTGEIPDVLSKLTPVLAAALEKREGAKPISGDQLVDALTKAIGRLHGAPRSEDDQAAIDAEVQRRVDEELAKLAGGADETKKGGKKGS